VNTRCPLRAWILWLALASLACEPAQDPEAELITTLQLVPEALRVRPVSLSPILRELDMPGMGSARDLLHGPGERWTLLDAGDGEVRVADPVAGLVTLGRRGEGPGELRNPSRVLVWADTVAVYDRTRGRVILYSLASREVVAELARPGFPSFRGTFAMTGTGSFVFPSTEHSGHYGEVVDREGQAVPWGSRLADFPAQDGPPMSNDIVIGMGDTLIVGDNTHAFLLVMDTQGRMLKGLRLPEQAIRAVDAYLEEELKAGRDLIGTYMRHAHLPVAGGLYVSLAGRPEGIFGVWVDLERGTGRLVVPSADMAPEDKDILWSVVATAIFGREPYVMVALTRNGLFAFELEDDEG